MSQAGKNNKKVHSLCCESFWSCLQNKNSATAAAEVLKDLSDLPHTRLLTVISSVRGDAKLQQAQHRDFQCAQAST